MSGHYDRLPVPQKNVIIALNAGRPCIECKLQQCFPAHDLDVLSVYLVPSLGWTVVTEGVMRAHLALTLRSVISQVHQGAVSVGTRRLDQSLLRTTREAAKAAKLVVYIMDITLASVATVISEPIMHYKSYATSELTVKILNLLHSCIWYGKLFIKSRRIFPSPSCPIHQKNVASPWDY